MTDAGTEAAILVVDDNEQNRALAQATLEDEGYQAILATSGEEGLSAFRERAPQCVLLDVRMPGLDGFEVCRRIRELPEGAHTPIIFLTALRDVEIEIRVADSGRGIPAEMREKVFERFVRLESGGAPASRSGYGLGLAFCRLAVEAHGGRIWVEDENPGAAFVMRLPRD